MNHETFDFAGSIFSSGVFAYIETFNFMNFIDFTNFTDFQLISSLNYYWFDDNIKKRREKKMFNFYPNISLNKNLYYNKNVHWLIANIADWLK